MVRRGAIGSMGKHLFKLTRSKKAKQVGFDPMTFCDRIQTHININ